MKAENQEAINIEKDALCLSANFTRAVDYARILHIERRKGTESPYMAHLLGVAALVMGEAGHARVPVTEEMVIAAILHDAAEDHGGARRLKDIEYNFGANVARMVEGLSDSLAEKPDEKQLWLARKETYLHRLREESADVQLISAADKLYNARAILEDYREIGARIWQRFKRERREQLWYFDELLKVFKPAHVGRIADELKRVVNELRKISAAEMD
jgi:(p)ppGpp synthase/HD superfamily hydrolase